MITASGSLGSSMSRHWVARPTATGSHPARLTKSHHGFASPGSAATTTLSPSAAGRGRCSAGSHEDLVADGFDRPLMQALDRVGKAADSKLFAAGVPRLGQAVGIEHQNIAIGQRRRAVAGEPAHVAGGANPGALRLEALAAS